MNVGKIVLLLLKFLTKILFKLDVNTASVSHLLNHLNVKSVRVKPVTDKYIIEVGMDNILFFIYI